MPELPEVETVRHSLEKVLVGKIISSVDLRYSPLISSPTPEKFVQMIEKKEITGVQRRGKYLLLIFKELLMAIHLRMTGSLLYLPEESPLEKHTHLIFSLQGEDELRYVDPRKFGRILLLHGREDIATLKNLGPEPFSFSLDIFKEMVRKRRGRMKSLLLNQGFLAGLGNIYSDEILFSAKIHPRRKADMLTEEEIERLFDAIHKVLEEAISLKGTSISDYRDGRGEKGLFQDHLQVYGHEGQCCCHCHHRVIREKIGGRSCYFCPSCQR